VSTNDLCDRGIYIKTVGLPFVDYAGRSREFIKHAQRVWVSTFLFRFYGPVLDRRTRRALSGRNAKIFGDPLSIRRVHYRGIFSKTLFPALVRRLDKRGSRRVYGGGRVRCRSVFRKIVRLIPLRGLNVFETT